MVKLEPDENLIYTGRKHWFVIVVELLGLAIVAIVPAVAPFVLTALAGFNFDPLVNIYAFMYCSFLVLTWIIGFVLWTDYYLDVVIITNKRIMYVDQKGLFFRNISSLRFEKIQDVTSEIDGIIPTFLDFGNLYIQTAGSIEEFIIRQIAKPNLIKDIIFRESGIGFDNSGIRDNV